MLPLLIASATFAPGAPRYWPKFGGTRDVRLLDGTWSFGYIDGWNSGFDSMSPTFKPADASTPNTTTVPSCFDTVAGGAAGYLGPRGVAMFRTTFRSTKSSAARLQFQSCSFFCRVWVNGREVGSHFAGGYVAFWLDVPAEGLIPGDGSNELFVLADNRFNATTAPTHTGGDFWHYGGLTRSVELHTLAHDAPVLWRVYVLPSSSNVTDDRQPLGAPSAVDITLVLTSRGAGRLEFGIGFDDGALVAMNGTTAEEGTLTLRNVQVPNARPWTPAAPHLHTVTVNVAGGLLTERFGLRRFGVDAKTARLTINGKVTKLVGWGHHTQWPVTAASPTDAQLDADVALLKKANANLVRGAHYPHDPRMLDRLDEAGLLFWSETLGPSVSVANTQDWEHFMIYQLQQMNEMIDNALNHAGVFTWGYFNEGPSDHPEACPAYAACAEVSTQRDPTRFTTWADNKKSAGACYEHATLIAFNDYPGWYDKSGDKSAPKLWNTFAAAAQQGTTKSGKHGTVGKPFMISETGAGGIFEWDANETDAKWTLAYQSEIVGLDVDVALANDFISGISLWHFNDFKVDNDGARWPSPTGGQENKTHCVYDHPPPTTFEELAKEGPPNCTYIKIDGRPGGENHKGSVDFWRREKPIFAEVAAKFKKANI